MMTPYSFQLCVGDSYLDMISGQHVITDQLWEKHGDLIRSSDPRGRWSFMMKAEGVRCERGHGPRICHGWDVSFPVQVTARVPFHADWELRVSNYLAADGR